MKIVKILSAILIIVLNGSFQGYKLPPVLKHHILIYSYSSGSYVQPGVQEIMQLGKENNFDVDTTSDATFFTPAHLKKYAAVVFISTTGINDRFNAPERQAFEQFIHHGGGFVGIHGASDCYDCPVEWPWYGKMVGAYFNGHGRVQDGTLIINDKTHISTRGLQNLSWARKDEWYELKDISPDLHVLISIDGTSYQFNGRENTHPSSWYHDFDGGRVFYTAMGHTPESFTEPLFLKHLLGGIQYAAGTKK